MMPIKTYPLYCYYFKTVHNKWTLNIKKIRTLSKNEKIGDATVKVDFSNTNKKSADNFKILFLEIKLTFEMSMTCELSN